MHSNVKQLLQVKKYKMNKMPDANIEGIIEKNKDKLEHQFLHTWEIRAYPTVEGMESVGVYYDHATGDISRPRDRESNENYSVVVLQYPVGHWEGPWTLRRNEDESVVVTRLNRRKTPFGKEPGDAVLEQSVDGFNAQRKSE
jgi:hypothetical protein